jgi:hypothetical protein
MPTFAQVFIMQILLILSGVALLGFTALDVLWTTLAVGSGGGPLTSRLCSVLWKVVLHQRHCRRRHHLLTIAAYIIILLPTLIWIFLTLVGWVLIFSVSRDSLISSDTNQPADLWNRIYFIGYTLVTLGLGDYRPQGPIWQLATVLAAGSGFFLVTLAITYLVAIAVAVTQKRQLAIYISCLGRTAEEILTMAWNGKDFGTLTQHLVSLAPMIVLYGQNYLAYPVIHYFHSLERHTAAEISIVILDEALTLLEAGVKPEYRPDSSACYVTRKAISEFLDMLKAAFIKPAAITPPLPNLDDLRAKGIPTVSDEDFQVAVSKLDKRRRLLLALVKSDGWPWKTVVNPYR